MPSVSRSGRDGRIRSGDVKLIVGEVDWSQVFGIWFLMIGMAIIVTISLTNMNDDDDDDDDDDGGGGGDDDDPSPKFGPDDWREIERFTSEKTSSPV